MSITLHKILFWPHLIAGVITGIVIAIMSLTGVAIAFEKQIVDWADRDNRMVQMPAPDAPRLSIDELLARVRASKPDAQLSAVTVYPEPEAVVVVGTGRSSGVYVNPYTGEVREQGAQGWRSFFHLMEEWHRWLGAQGDNRPVGKAITGVSNIVFLLLGITGLYLWWPRKWTWRTVRPVLWFRGGLQGKARNFNWHNVTGFWFLPVLLVLTSTGMVISYKWASELVFKLVGEQPPVAQGPMASAPIQVPTPPEGTQPLGLEPLFAEARKQVPAWESVTLRMASPPRGNGPPRPTGPQALTFAIREQRAWPLFSSAQVSLDPFTAQVLKREVFTDYTLGRRVRTWMRFLHTGEALGWAGQLVASLASLGSALLVWTGFAMSWRRFFPRRRTSTATTGDTGLTPEPSEPTA